MVINKVDSAILVEVLLLATPNYLDFSRVSVFSIGFYSFYNNMFVWTREVF